METSQNFAAAISSMVLEPSFFDIFLEFGFSRDVFPKMGQHTPLPHPQILENTQKMENMEKMEKWGHGKVGKLKNGKTWKNVKKRRSQNHARNDRGKILSISHTGRHRIRHILENPICGSTCQKIEVPKPC